MNNVVLEAKELSKRYGTLIAVQDLSMQVLEGEVFGFLGPNGAGKTTSIHMLCGLLTPDAGEVLVRGKRIANGDPAVRARVGMCPQKIVVWERLTCLEQLVFIGEMYGLSAQRCPAALGAIVERCGFERAAQPAGPDAFRGHAAAPEPGPGAGARPGDCGAGRAGSRPGPADAHAGARVSSARWPGAKPWS